MQRQFRPYQAMPGGGRASAADNCEAHLRVTAIGTKTSPGSVRFCGCHRPSAVKPGVDAVDTSGRQAGGLMVLPDVSSTNYRDLIIALAARHRLPAVYPYRHFAANGGLMSYGTDVADVFRRAASYRGWSASGDDSTLIEKVA
jgi:hypothetical protein